MVVLVYLYFGYFGNHAQYGGISYDEKKNDFMTCLDSSQHDNEFLVHCVFHHYVHKFPVSSSNAIHFSYPFIKGRIVEQNKLWGSCVRGAEVII